MSFCVRISASFPPVKRLVQSMSEWRACPGTGIGAGIGHGRFCFVVILFYFIVAFLAEVLRYISVMQTGTMRLNLIHVIYGGSRISVYDSYLPFSRVDACELTPGGHPA